MSQERFEALAEEALSTISEIADGAAQKLASEGHSSANSFASGNTLTGGRAYQNLANIGLANREAWEALQREPSIARLVLEDDKGKARVVYIARKSSLPLASGKQLASYGSPIGRFAELPVGEEASVTLQGQRQVLSLVEKISLRPSMADGEWDSTGSQYRHVDFGVFSIDSLRALLHAVGLEAGDELDQLLEQAAIANGVQAGIGHQIRTAMGLRDQPILDQFQGEIFRLPLDSELIILGPPGTGKTTTLIKRLGQKLDIDNLDENERRVARAPGQSTPHDSSWLMFTPSDLLKHYLKEAFNREQVPASDARIKTWMAYRNDIARNTLGILRTANGGKYTFKPDMANLAAAVIVDSRAWYEAFSDFHEHRLKNQLKDGAIIVKESARVAGMPIVEDLQQLAKGLDNRAWMEVYRDLDKRESQLKAALEESKGIADDLLKQERNRVFNRDKAVFQRLAQYLANLQQEDDEPDEEAEFDEDDTDASGAQYPSDIQNAVKAYLGALRTLARSRYRRRNLPKGSPHPRLSNGLVMACRQTLCCWRSGNASAFRTDYAAS